MSIYNIENNLIRRSLLVIGTPLFFSFGLLAVLWDAAKAYFEAVCDFPRDFMSCWKRK